MAQLLLPSGQAFPQLGLGTWQGEGDEIKNALTEALKLGYRHIDSAWEYANEVALGEAFKTCFEAGLVTRPEIFYTSKVPQHGHRREKVKYFLQLALKNLGFEYVDLYLIHFPVSCQYVEGVHNWPTGSDGKMLLDEDLDLADTWKGMEDCVDAGLAKNIGLSNFNAEQVQYIYDRCRIKPANLQVECHVYLQQRPLLDLCKKLGMTLTAFSPLGSSGTPDFLKKKYGMDFKLPATVLEEPLLKTMSEKYHKTVAQIALRFLIQLGCAVIPKSVKASRLKENSEIFDFALEDGDMKEMEALDRGSRIFDFTFVKDSKKYPF